jgi:hypothetical protein
MNADSKPNQSANIRRIRENPRPILRFPTSVARIGAFAASRDALPTLLVIAITSCYDGS